MFKKLHDNKGNFIENKNEKIFKSNQKNLFQFNLSIFYSV